MISVGQTIGNYRITAKLGEGGMGVVYLAEHPVIGKKVAMKAIHPELSRNPEVVSRFMTEAKSVNQIGHDHIVDINDFGTTPDGEFYFVMEFLQGEAMSERLKRDGSFPLRQAMAIAAQVADALDASHKHGIVHRDLKPENIYLITRGATKDFVKVLDFGLAKLTQGDERVTHKTRTGSVMGTPYYMSPEQCEGKASIDNRADIYSLGVILFEMLTGKVPFGGEGYGEIIVKHITMAAPSARGFVPELPRSVDLILFRALAKKREDRFQTMAELHAALLDPEAYAATAPAIGIPEDISSVQRAAGPMSRAELTRASQGRMGTIRGIGEDGSVPSTFRQGLGEVVEEPPRKSRAPKVLLAVAAAAAAAVGAVVFLKGQQNAAPEHPAAAVAPAAPAAARPPASVRVNFNSDPSRATIVRADTGQELGKTPLSMELAYGDAAIEFVFKKEGFENKVVSVVPNLPAPLFATLQAIPPKVEDKPAPVAVEPHPAAAPAHKPAKKKPHGPRLDDDAVLEPSFK